jgi:hypothetical protein
MQRLLLSVCALLVVSFLPLSAVVVTIGTGTSTNDSITYPAPYGNWYTMARHQILVRASEIIAAGGSAGSIASLAFNVAATNNTQALQNFTIKLKQTSATSLSSSFDNTGWTTVYSVSSYTVTTGWNTHTFSTPFAWDGSSNLLIDICFYQGSCYNWTYNASTYYTTTAFTSVVYYRDDCDFGVCSTSSVTGTSSNRPNLRLDIQAGMPNDAGIAGIVAPVAPFSPGSQTVEVLLKNYGNNTISSVTINWSVNGTPQTPYNWTGSLAPGATARVTIGSYNFAPRTLYTFVVATSNPNGTTDPNSANDSFTGQLAAALAGTYTVGGSTPDFASPQAAVQYLHIGGVLDTVRFRIRSGTYNGQLSFGAIPGAGSATRWIAFESESGNAADVVIQASNTSAANYVVRVNGTDWLRFRRLTFTSNGTGSYRRVVELTGGTENLTFEGCVFNGGPATYNYSWDEIVFYSSNNACHNLTLRNNTFTGGVGSLWIDYWTAPLQGVQIVGNTLQGFYYFGAVVQYANALLLAQNTITALSGSGFNYGAYLYNLTGSFQVRENVVTVDGGYGLYLDWRPSTEPSGLVANNVIIGGVGTGNSTTGLYAYTANVNFYHNTVHLGTSDPWSAAMYVDGYQGINVVNNIFVNAGGGYAYYVGWGSPLSSSNYNDLYSSGSYVGNWDGTDYATLADWQAGTGYDANSVSVLPPFGSDKYHLTEVAEPLIGTAALLTTVPKDIDGEDRRNPYMGADEVIPVITITQQPADTVYGCQGTDVTISVQASVTFNASLSYQWLQNGAPIPEGYDGRFFGTQTPTLTIWNTQARDAGSYACLITANSGATPVQSDLAELIIAVPLTIVEQPQSVLTCLEGEAILRVVAEGTVLGYQWQREEATGWVDIPGATGAEYRISNAQYTNSARYRCIVFGTCGTDQVPSEPAIVYVLGPTQILSAPDTVYTGVGGRAQLSVEANVVGAPPTYQAQYQWYRGTQPLVDGGRISGARSSVLVIDGVQPQDFGTDYWVEVVGLCGRAEQRGYAVVSAGVEIVEQPQGGEWCVGSDVVLSVQAQATAGQLAYQWRRNGQPLVDGGRISGARTAQLRIGSVQPGDAGTYDVVVSLVGAGVDVVSQGAQVEVREAVQVVQQPQGGSVCEGEALALEVGATGGGLQYQWYKDGQPISGATQARYEVAAARLQDAGTYWCVVRNVCGQEQTVQVEVSVVEAPRIVRDVPQAVQVQQGQPLVLEIQASGAGLQYQWYKDGQPISGATQARYEVAAAQQRDTGTYWCVVRGTCGQVESGRVTVSVVVSVAGDAGEREWVEVVPQPVSGVGQVRYGVMGRGEVVVRDVLGREVSRVRVEGRGEVGIGFGGAGVYVVQLEREGRVVGQQVVVVVR